MCGIVGLVRADGGPVESDTLRRMCSRIEHRGPDDEGHYSGAGVGLGMRRLAVIDVSGGRQPVFNESRQIVVVCNGEIYNFRTVRAELDREGHRLNSSTDVEVIPHLYESEGDRFLQSLDGMFALALWDARNQSLQLAVDRVGKKPLYYSMLRTGDLAFASELKAILALPGVGAELDPVMLEVYLARGYLPAPHTIYRGIFKLSPGYRLRWQAGEVTLDRYWSFPKQSESPRKMSDVEAMGHLERLLKEATSKRLVADVPLGAFLSGGVDSSAVVALMSEVGGQPPKTFAIGFDSASYSELDHARAVARHFGADHHECVVKPDAVNDLGRIVAQFDEPFADASALPMYYLSRMTRQHVTVALSGDGGDEVFGGYRTYPAMRAMALLDGVPLWLRKTVAKLLRAFPESTDYASAGRRMRRLAELAVESGLASRYCRLNDYWPDDSRSRLLRLSGICTDRTIVDRYAEVAGLDPVSAAMWVDSKVYMPGDVLVKVDRMSMMNSLEVRCPLLDVKVIEFMAALPVDMKLRGLTGKYLLRRLMQNKLPPKIARRPKHGFSVPVGEWLRAELHGMFNDLVLSSGAQTEAYLDRREILDAWRQHQGGERDNGNQLWAVLVLELWMRAAKVGHCHGDAMARQL